MEIFGPAAFSGRPTGKGTISDFVRRCKLVTSVDVTDARTSHFQAALGGCVGLSLRHAGLPDVVHTSLNKQ
jgi:hypothetical protein